MRRADKSTRLVSELLIDIGNSNIKWSWIQGTGSAEGLLSHLSTDDLEHAFQSEWAVLPAPEKVVIASVSAPEILLRLKSWIMRSWQVAPMIVESSPQGYGVINGYRIPGQLGVDRWLTLIACRSLFPAETVCIVDCGTAITLDVLDHSGRHHGGTIMPGFRLMHESLESKTQIGALPATSCTSPLGTSTADATAIGLEQAAAGMVERLYYRMERELRVSPRLVLTGNDAGRLAPLLSVSADCIPGLVMKGLHIIAGSEGH